MKGGGVFNYQHIDDTKSNIPEETNAIMNQPFQNDFISQIKHNEYNMSHHQTFEDDSKMKMT